MSGIPSIPSIRSCSDEELQRLREIHAEYQALERIALAGGPEADQAHQQMIQAISPGIVFHFRPNAKGSYNPYQIKEVVRERSADNTQRYFVHYIPLYEGASNSMYRRLVVGTAEGEEDGWLLPVVKTGYQGTRFIRASS